MLESELKEKHMIRKAKVLGLALVAVLSMSAVAASGAQAETWFHSDVNPTVITGEETETNKFVTSGGNVKCTSKFDATSEGTKTETKPGEVTYTTKTITIKPTYSNCTAFGFVGATIDMNSCDYLFHLTQNTPPTATVDVVCNPGDDITITTSFCTVHVPAQTNLAHVVFESTGATTNTKDIDATLTFEGIKYTETSGCFVPGERANGTYTGKVTLKGFEDKGPKGSYTEGNQAGIWIE